LTNAKVKPTHPRADLRANASHGQNCDFLDAQQEGDDCGGCGGLARCAHARRQDAM